MLLRDLKEDIQENIENLLLLSISTLFSLFLNLLLTLLSIILEFFCNRGDLKDLEHALCRGDLKDSKSSGSENGKSFSRFKLRLLGER